MKEKTVYLLAGGPSSDADQMTEDFRTILSHLRKPYPAVAYIGTANHENEAFFQRIRAPLEEAGAGNVIMVPVLSESADIKEAERILREADAVFLSGGEVEDGMSGLKKTGLDTFLRELFESGRLFFGISAGSIMMGTSWVHWDTEDDDSTSSLFPCLGFVPRIFDAHGENEDWRELKCALRLLGRDAEGCGLSSGGFYSAGSSGTFVSYRNGPEIFLNTGTDIIQKRRDD